MKPCLFIILFIFVGTSDAFARGRAEGKIKGVSCITGAQTTSWLKTNHCVVIFDKLVNNAASGCANPMPRFRVSLETETGKALWNLVMLAYTTGRNVIAEGVEGSCSELQNGDETLQQILIQD